MDIRVTPLSFVASSISLLGSDGKYRSLPLLSGLSGAATYLAAGMPFPLDLIALLAFGLMIRRTVPEPNSNRFMTRSALLEE